MQQEILSLKFVNVKDNFLHFSPASFKSFSSPTIRGFKAVRGNETFYFSASSTPLRGVQINQVGINSIYAKSLRLEENDILVLHHLYNLGSIKKIYVSPATEDDYSILYAASSSVENNLLNQLRIVWTNQKFCAWISSNICVSLVVDSIEPEIPFGRLEEYSEVVVDNVVRNNNNVLKKIMPNQNPPSYLDENLRSKKPLKFRTVFIDGVEETKVFCHPFIVYAYKNNIDDEYLSFAKDLTSVWSMKVFNLDETEGKELFVHLEIIEEDKDIFKGKDICGLKTLFISESVKNFFDLKLGSKVILKPEKNIQKPKEVVGVLVSPLFHNENEESLKLLVYNAFLHSIVCYGSLLLNTKAEFPLDKKKKVLLTLRPLDIKWSFLKILSLKDLSISITEFNPESKYEETVIPKYVKIESFDPIFQDAKLTVSLNFDGRLTRCGLFDNIVITGQSGCGKTALVDELLRSLSSSPYFLFSESLDCTNLKGKRIEVVSKVLSESLNLCKNHQPSILFLDNISSLAGVSKAQNETTELSVHFNRLSHKIFELIEDYQRDNDIMIIACSQPLDSLNPILCSARGRPLFTTHISVPFLTQTDRHSILKQLIEIKAQNVFLSEEDYFKISVETEGFLISDLVNLTNKSFFEALQRKALSGKLNIKNSDLTTSLSILKPTLLQGISSNKKASYDLSHVGGLKSAKEKLTEVILWPLLYPQIMKQNPLKSQNAVLIYGAPGTGKTLLANAIAGESKLNFIAVKGPELMSKYIGQSEEGVRNIFQKAQAAKPCLLFFDEFDSLAPRRGKDQTGVTDRVVNQLLTALDGVEPLTGVSIVVASSRPDLIDPALLRPGRIGSSLMCPFPDLDARFEILKILSQNVNLDKNVDLKVIAEKTDGFSGADLKGIFTTAQIRMIDKKVEGLFDDPSSSIVPSILKEKNQFELKQEDILTAIEETTPSLSPSEKAKFEKIYYEFKNPRPPEMNIQKVTFA